MLTRARTFLLLGSFVCASAGLGLGACGGGTSGGSSSQDGGGSDAAHAGHDSAGATDGNGGGLDSTFGGEAGPDSSPGTDSGGGTDSGHGSDSGNSDVAAGDGGGDAGVDAPADAVADVNCGSTPTLHQDEAGTIFCGFGFEAGADLLCPTGQQCCLGGPLDAGGFAAQQCTPSGSACTNPPGGGAIPIECGQSSDCTANGEPGNVCCLQGATGPALVAGCGYYRATHGTAVVCELPATAGGSCAPGETQICSTQSDCPAGTTCTPMKWKIFQLGFCL
jgi:hypothetical protein